MRVNDKLYYFGQPRTGSEFIRDRLALRWSNDHDSYKWDACALDYCHVRPSRFIRETGVDSDAATLFALVRNPFERLVSSWMYGSINNYDYVAGRSFSRFIEYIYENRLVDPETLPHSWMYISTCKYFGDAIGKIKFFKLENMHECLEWLDREHGIRVNNIEKTNTTDHDHYSLYYDNKTKWMVSRLYEDDIKFFGYRFIDLNTQKLMSSRKYKYRRYL